MQRKSLSRSLAGVELQETNRNPHDLDGRSVGRIPIPIFIMATLAGQEQGAFCRIALVIREQKHSRASVPRGERGCTPVRGCLRNPARHGLKLLG
jgi:hypothetical protein